MMRPQVGKKDRQLDCELIAARQIRKLQMKLQQATRNSFAPDRR